MPTITILTPRSPMATTKAFQMIDGKVRKISDYDIGKYFNFATATISEISDLYSVLDRLKDTKAIRIYGQPTLEILEQKARQLKDMTFKGAARRKVNFEDKGTQLLLIDADGWPVPDGFSIESKEELHKTIQEIVVNKMGLNFLDDVNYCCLLSASQWKKKELRAHLYYLIDEEVTLSELTRWGKAQNIITEDYKVDYSLFRQVQPDFISKRLCQGFDDPLSDSLRLTLHCDSLFKDVAKVALLEHLSKVEDKAGAKILETDPDDPYATNVLVSDERDPIGNSWEASLMLCGKFIQSTGNSSVNEPAFRAAAQLVREKGERDIKEHFTSYIDQFYGKLWEAVRKNKVRDNQETRDTYTKAKIKGYIETALAKDFGAVAKQELANINRQIDNIRESKDPPHFLLDRVILEEMRIVKEKDTGKWSRIRLRIKTELKGKVSLSELDSALKVDEPKINEGQEAENVLDMFEFFVGQQDRMHYLRLKTSSCQSVRPIYSAIDMIRNLVFEKLGAKYSNLLPDLILNKAEVEIDDPMLSRFKTVPIAIRSYMDKYANGGQALYYNVAGESGVTLRITEQGIEKIPTKDAPVIWRETNVAGEAFLDDYEDIVGVLGETAKNHYIEDYINGLSKYSTAKTKMDIVDIVAWQVVATVNTGIANLLQIVGPSEGGKSSTAVFTKELVDPSSADASDDKMLHKKIYTDDSLAKILNQTHVAMFDNLTHLTKDEQSTLCTVATGMVYSMRRLYSNAIDNISIRKPVILTTIHHIVTAPDLLTRALSIEVDPKRKSRNINLHREWEKDAPAMRVGLLFLVAKVIGMVNKRERDKKNVNERNLWSTEVKKYMFRRFKMVPSSATDEEAEEKVHEIKRDLSTRIAMNNGHVRAVTAWLLHSPEFKNMPTNTLVNMSAAEAFKSLDQFVFSSFDVEYDVYGEKVILQHDDRQKNVYSFGKITSQHSGAILEATGWSIEKVNKRVSGRYSRILEIKKNFEP